VSCLPLSLQKITTIAPMPVQCCDNIHVCASLCSSHQQCSCIWDRQEGCQRPSMPRTMMAIRP
jgi:hypothetical protein